MQGNYNFWLVACSYLVAVAASYAALELAGRVVVSRGSAARAWLIGGSVAMGLGIWSMHFIGMLAFHLPIPLAYDLPVTLLSVVPAVLSAFLVLALIRGGTLSGFRLAAGAILLGGGIAAMHYIGMAAIPIQPAIRYDPVIFTASIIVAIVVAFVALKLAFSLSGAGARWKKFGAALVMGGAICAMHYTGMAAAVFAPDSFCAVTPGAIQNTWLASIIAFNTVIVLIATVAIASYDARLSDQNARMVSALQSTNQALMERNQRAEQLTAELRVSEARLRLMVEHLPAGAAYIEGQSIFFNPRVKQITGYGQGELSTLDAWFKALFPGDPDEVRRLYLADRAAGFPAPRMVRIRRKDGEERLLEFAAYGDDSGEVWLLSDVTERVKAEEKFRVLFEHSSDAHLLFDETGVIDCNNAALEMIGYADKNQIVGTHPATLSPRYQPDGRLSEEKAVEMDATARQNGYHRFEWIHRRQDATEFPVEVTLTPVDLAGKQVVLTVWHDLTKRKQGEAEIIRAREQLRLALIGSKLALFEWDVQTGEVFLGEYWAEMIGSRPGPTRTTIDALAQLVHPEETGRLMKLIRDVIKGDSAFYEAEHRVRTSSGNFIWVQSHGKVVERDNEGKALRVSGTNADITNRKQAEQALNEAHEKLGSGLQALERRNREITLLAELSNFLISCVTVEEACDAIPKYSRTLFPEDQGALYLLRSSRDYLNLHASWGGGPHPEPTFKPEDCWALRRGRPYAVTDPQKDAVCTHVAGSHNDGRYFCVPLVVQSDILGLLWLAFADTDAPEGEGAAALNAKQQLAVTLSEQIALALSNIRLRENLRQQTIRDPLTGLYNRRFLEEALARELARCRRSATSFGVLMMDLDHFKRFNDTFGHDAGDSVLRSVARALLENAREGDIACRFGGEELVMVLPDSGREGAIAHAERILDIVRNLHVVHNDRTLGSVTLSIGLAMYPQNGETIKAVLNSADRALYEAKGAGRDRLEVATT